jgi:outer membrane protein
MKRIGITLLLTVLCVSTAFSADEAPLVVPPSPNSATVSGPAAVEMVPTPSPPSRALPPAASVPAKAPTLLPQGPLLVSPSAASSGIKIGYLDFTKIAQESGTALKVKKSLTATGDKFKKQLTAKGKKLEALKKTLEGQMKQMSPLEREAKEKEFQTKVKEYQEAVQNAEKEMAKQEETVTRKLIEQVSKTVREYGEKNGYTLIVATKDLLYFDGNHPLTDVTEAVITILDR